MDKVYKDMKVELEHSTVDNSLLNSDNSNIPSMIIEELDENAIKSLDVDMDEFVEVKTLQIQEVKELIPKYELTPICNSKDVKDMEDQDVLLTADEEHQLTKQFLNGELTFSEYSSRMDQDIDLDITENDNIRSDIKTECETVQTIADLKSQKTSNVQQVRQKRKRRTLPTVLQGLMGEANLRFAKGETNNAERICMEIIREVPSAPEPFQTLAMIYENDQPEKSLQFALIAAHLSPKNADQWIRLANQSLETGNIKQAITCYSKAIQSNPKDIHLYETRAELQELNGDKKAYIRAYTKLIHQLETDDSEYIKKYAKVLIKHYIQEDNTEMALEVMEFVFDKCSHVITLEEVNIMTELLIVLKQFQRCLSILIKYTDIEVQYKDNKKQENTVDNETNQNIEEIESCNIPDNVAVDLKAKCIITLIELNYIRIADELVSKFHMLENPEISGDLFLDIAETFMGKKEYHRALVLLDPLLKSPKFSLAAVWLRHAECWVGCNDIDKAINSYKVVRTLSPQHLDARLALAKLYKEKQLYNNAIEVLYQNPECDELDPDVVYQRTLLLFKVGRYEEYFSSGMLLFSRHCVKIRRKIELNSLARAAGVRQRLESLQLRRLNFGEKLDDENAPTFIANEKPSEKKEFLLFLQMCKLAFQLKKYGFLQRLSFTALTSKRFKKRNSHILFLCLLSCIHNQDSFYGYNIVREFVRVCHRPNVWNLLNIIIQRAEDLRHNRFIMRLLGRDDIFSYLHIMHANNCLVSGTYKYALNSYVSLFKVAPSALLALLIGVTQMQMACQRIASKKTPLVIQAFAFLKKYAELRGKEGEQEANYNIARAFHQLGLLPSAINFYKLVLDEEPSDLVKQHANLLDLRKEAAFNLHLIYLQSDNHLLARTYLENYITI
ncbi:general transcription factor 3C polypeptide 3 [Pseudomyrmex gracilis]|uniref:general transcription factor 3C polypeptide 3 n=1 Tax=Pseudomyrmex gracilis TaxID=219809 RepID=UPI00099587B0|nr:general transcription factor 3C polypeptide 3 [Pseudomyrmex gracilis]